MRLRGPLCHPSRPLLDPEKDSERARGWRDRTERRCFAPLGSFSTPVAPLQQPLQKDPSLSVNDHASPYLPYYLESQMDLGSGRLGLK